MRKLFYIIFLVVVLTGCNQSSKKDELSYKEVKMESMDQDVQSFFEDAKNENGVYLYEDGEKKYMFLNSFLVAQGTKAYYFSDFDIKDEDETLGIYFEEKSTDEYLNKKLRNQVFYEIDLNKKYEFIKLYKNVREWHFSSISGR